jgi:hypothetical protein
MQGPCYWRLNPPLLGSLVEPIAATRFSDLHARLVDRPSTCGRTVLLGICVLPREQRLDWYTRGSRDPEP